MEKQNISATVDRALLKRLNALVKETERNRSWLISKAIESYLDELEDVRIAAERIDDERLTPHELRKNIGL